MIDNRSPEEKYALRFGELAVEMGYITIWQLEEGLIQQLYDDSLELNPHKLIGEILFEKGWMTLNQIDSVLKEIFTKQA